MASRVANDAEAEEIANCTIIIWCFCLAVGCDWAGLVCRQIQPASLAARTWTAWKRDERDALYEYIQGTLVHLYRSHVQLSTRCRAAETWASFRRPSSGANQ